MRISAPSSRAADATAYVAMCGSTYPSPGIHTAPYSESGDAAGIRRRTSSGPTSSASRPIPWARLTPRRSSMKLSGLDAIRRLPTASNTPSSRYSSTL